MRKALIQLLALATAISALGQTPSAERPLYDSEGRYVGYVYADGKADHYRYDDKWRMTHFVDRDGKTTLYVYRADGTMTTVHPDGSH